MAGRFWLTNFVACTVTLAIACTEQAPGPASPSAAGVVAGEVGPDGETLKATAPTAQSPINSQVIEDPEVTLRIANATTSHAEGIPLTYRFRVFNGAGNLAYEVGNLVAGAGGTTSHTITATLEAEQRYTWQTRAEYQGAFGPWSSTASFIAPASNGYIRGNELYDPLINGETVGSAVGNTTFVPGVGIRLNTQDGYVSYELPQTVTEGEFSMLVTNLRTNTEGAKTKLFAMGEGYSDIVTNDRRMTVEKRGNPPGIIAWRFITHNDQIDTVGSERVTREFNPALDYFWRAEWRNNFFRVVVREGGVNGREIYNFGKGFAGDAYDPNPHVAFLGAPVGRSGPDGASVDGAIIRQVWLSARPRPSFANR